MRYRTVEVLFRGDEGDPKEKSYKELQQPILQHPVGIPTLQQPQHFLQNSSKRFRQSHQS